MDKNIGFFLDSAQAKSFKLHMVIILLGVYRFILGLNAVSLFELNSQTELGFEILVNSKHCMVAMHTEMNMHNILNVTLIMNTFLLLVLHMNVIHLNVIVLV